MGLVKLKIIQITLQVLKKITLKLLYLQAIYETDDYDVENKKFDLRTIPERIKRYIIHDQSIIDKRMAECKACDHFIKLTSQCKKCGCFMKIKTKLATQKCPIDKWGREQNIIEGSNVTPIAG